MTQGQWLRTTDRNPSLLGPTSNFNGHQHDLTHPVESVSWTDCTSLMRRLGLELPHEAQWEYGCRGGTDFPWWTGRERESLKGHVNIADQAAARMGAGWAEIMDWPELDDGWGAHAPVGSMDANAFGLHEVHGNVCEWCADGFADYTSQERIDPVTPGIGAASVVYRGGSLSETADHARSAFRNNAPQSGKSFNLGLRPARVITKP
jgi:formylglycine-generating enzyme required for sulfatase activity